MEMEMEMEMEIELEMENMNTTVQRHLAFSFHVSGLYKRASDLIAGPACGNTSKGLGLQ